MSDIYILFLKETDIWKEKTADIVHNDDLIYLLCGDQKTEPGSSFSADREVRCLYYPKETVSEVMAAVEAQYEKDKEKYLPEETRIILLSAQKRYFQELKLKLLKKVSAVGYQTAPGQKCRIKKKTVVDSNEITDNLIPAEPEVKKEEPVKTVEVKNEPESVSCNNLKEAKGAVCYYLSRRAGEHIKEKTGTDLNSKEIFDLIELIIKCDERQEFISSWDTMSNKSILPSEEAFTALKKEAEYVLSVSDCLYRDDIF